MKVGVDVTSQNVPPLPEKCRPNKASLLPGDRSRTVTITGVEL